MKKYYFLLAALAMANFACCKSQNPEREDYVCQDGFYFSREGGSTIPTDTALHQGFLSDGTRYFLYKNEREDYPHDSCIVQQVVREAEQAVIAVGNIEYEKALRRIEENRFSEVVKAVERYSVFCGYERLLNFFYRYFPRLCLLFHSERGKRSRRLSGKHCHRLEPRGAVDCA